MGPAILPLVIIASGTGSLPILPADRAPIAMAAEQPAAIASGIEGSTADNQATGQATSAAPASKPADTRDIVVTARRRTPGDPLAAINVEMYATTQAVDRAVVRPAAIAYERAVPSPIRDGLRNFFTNLHEPVVFVNYLLQLKPGKAAETAGRFVVNTTVGVAGIFDIAKRKPFRLPHRRNGFSDTLGFYGVKPGPFLFLPLIGPTTVRDLVGGIVDRGVMPLYLGTPPFNQPAFALATGSTRLLDRRDRADDRIEAERASSDPYAAARDDYLKQRAAEVNGLHRAPPPPTSPNPVAPAPSPAP